MQVNAQQITNQKDTIKQWPYEWQKQFLSDRENPEKWDTPHHIEDLQNNSQPKHTPMTVGIFPNPNYDCLPSLDQRARLTTISHCFLNLIADCHNLLSAF